MSAPDRLFVPLSGGPYSWFREGGKTWELRKRRGQYTSKHVRVGRRVELRLGYSPGRSIHGTVVEVVQAETSAAFFDKVDWALVLPLAGSLEGALQVARAFVGSEPVIGFRVEIDPQD